MYEKLKSYLIQWAFKTQGLIIGKDSTIKVLIYVDDILITGTHNVVFEEFISKFSTMFMLKDLGILSYFLGIEVLYADWEIYLS